MDTHKIATKRPGESLKLHDFIKHKYLINSKANCKIDNQYDDYIVIKITSSINSPSIAL